MSGHSKWATIKHSKGLADAKRSATFSKVSKDIIIAARVGQSGDVNFNPILRVAVAKARSVNMPNDKIQNAINKGMGILAEGEQSFEKTYEAYSPGGIAMLIDVETDNPNRALTDVRTIIGKNGGKMVPEGSISWQFKELGLIKASLKIDLKSQNTEDLVLEILGTDGVEDIEFTQEDSIVNFEIYTKKEYLRELNNLLKETFGENIEVQEVTIIKDNESRPELDEETVEKLDNISELLKENEDVSNVWF